VCVSVCVCVYVCYVCVFVYMCCVCVCVCVCVYIKGLHVDQPLCPLPYSQIEFINHLWQSCAVHVATIYCNMDNKYELCL